ncbi:MAG: hypothetical protein U9Q71_05935, partial [Pseudomonadota bacterium]|nr:hypothetical protein [Pseudomonadota bacterium]
EEQSKTLPETRQAAAGEVERQVAEAVFSVRTPAEGQTIYGGTALPNGDYAVYALHEVRAGDPAQAPEAQREQVRQLLLGRNGPEFYQALLEGLRQRAKIKIYEDQL